jgi:hypothetical protein
VHNGIASFLNNVLSQENTIDFEKSSLSRRGPRAGKSSEFIIAEFIDFICRLRDSAVL